MVTVPPRIAGGFRLENVTFGYADADRTALDGVDLELRAGSVVAIVGDNGAGKTTLVKLLARMYEPVAGSILLDGTDIRDFDLSAYRARLSAGFQDFMHFEMRVREAVGVGDLPRIEDSDAVAAALTDADAADLMAALTDGLETQLGQAWPGGVDLSGGQWQKLAIARGLMREDPLLLVLDEPTAALDPYAEHALFGRFAAASRRWADSGGCTILISHRFSTVRMADHIVVLDGGRILEQGSHDDLIHAAGRYAELYELQAAAYR